jgi:hypothetical protein
MALETLTKAFEQSQIKKRPGAFGRTLEYVPANEIIKRLIDAGAWNCRIVKEVVTYSLPIEWVGLLRLCYVSRLVTGTRSVA